MHQYQDQRRQDERKRHQQYGGNHKYNKSPTSPSNAKILDGFRGNKIQKRMENEMDNVGNKCKSPKQIQIPRNGKNTKSQQHRPNSFLKKEDTTLSLLMSGYCRHFFIP